MCAAVTLVRRASLRIADEMACSVVVYLPREGGVNRRCEWRGQRGGAPVAEAEALALLDEEGHVGERAQHRVVLDEARSWNFFREEGAKSQG